MARISSMALILEVMRKAYEDTKNSPDPLIAMTASRIGALIREYRGIELSGPQINNGIQSLKANKEIEKYGEEASVTGGKRYAWASIEVLKMFERDTSPETVKSVEIQPESPTITEDSEKVETHPMTRAERKRAKNGSSSPVAPASQGNVDLAELTRAVHQLQKDVGDIHRVIQGDFPRDIRLVADTNHQVVAEIKAMQTGIGHEVAELIRSSIAEVTSSFVKAVKTEFQTQMTEEAKAFRQGVYTGWNAIAEIAKKFGLTLANAPEAEEVISFDEKNNISVDLGDLRIEEKPNPLELLERFAKEKYEEKRMREEGPIVHRTKDPEELPQWARILFFKNMETFGERYGRKLKEATVEAIDEVESIATPDGMMIINLYMKDGSKVPLIKLNAPEILGKTFKDLFSN